MRFLPFYFLAFVAFTGCAKPQQHEAATHSASKSRMTEAQVIEAAKPQLSLPEHESYRTQFKDGIWTVGAEPDAGFKQRSWRTVTISDSNGQVIGVADF